MFIKTLLVYFDIGKLYNTEDSTYAQNKTSASAYLMVKFLSIKLNFRKLQFVKHETVRFTK